MKKNASSERSLGKRLASEIRSLHQISPKKSHQLEIPGQPFDRLLLKLSPLYRRSRELFLSGGGSLQASLLSSPRSLGSVSLVSPVIQYSPIEDELFWISTDSRELETRPERLLELRTWVTGVFHEQNHRILWRLLPPPPKTAGDELRRYLHFAESLVVMLDMHLADALDQEIAQALYQVGSIYDPGSEFLRELKPWGTGLARRYHRNALQAAQEATYLNLELYSPAEIGPYVESLFPSEARPPRGRSRLLLRRAAERALRLDRQFVENTNPEWLRRHGAQAGKLLRKFSTENRELSPLRLDDTQEAYFLRCFWADRIQSLYLNS